MKILSPNSKKCSAAEAPSAWARITVISLSALLATAWALAGEPALSSRSLLSEIRQSQSGSFDSLLGRWRKSHGTRAVQPLLEIAKSSLYKETERYVALMGAARLGGRATSPVIVPLLKDPSWMIRSGALRALKALGDPKTAGATLSLLHDPALVVRLEAVETVEHLRPRGASDALVAVLRRSENYHQQKALWVPLRALAALRELQAKEAAPKLRPLLDHVKDPALQSETVRTLESLTGRRLASSGSLPAKVREWKQALSR